MKGGGLSHLFAPAEEFAEMLEQTGASSYKVGTADALSNKDNACKFQFSFLLITSFKAYLV